MRIFIFTLLCFCFAISTSPLKAHGIKQSRIDIVEKNEVLEWTITLPFTDLVELVEINVDENIDADYDNNWKIITTHQQHIKEWTQSCIHLRDIPNNVKTGLIEDELSYPRLETPFNNFKLKAINASYDQFTIIEKIQITFNTSKKKGSNSLSLSQHFFKEDFSNIIDCVLNFTNKKGKLHAPLQLLSGHIAHISIDKISSTGESMRQFIRQGFLHIIMGLDHLYFLLGLLLIHIRFKQLLWAVTLFTLSHCCTLFISSMGIVNVSPHIVEPLIALTVAASGYHGWKITGQLKEGKEIVNSRLWYVIVFIFGLVHGLGFSFFVKEMLPEGKSILLWLFSFNCGIELGQIAFLLLFFSILKVFSKKKSCYVMLRYVISAFLLFAGSYYCVQHLIA